MKYVYYAGLYLVLLILHCTLLRFTSIQNTTPDLLLLATIFLSVREGQVAGILFGFIFGVIDDLTTPGLLGLSALSKSLAGYVGGLFYGIKSGLDIRFVGLIVVLCTSVHELTVGVVLAFDPALSFWSALINYSFPRFLYSGTVGFIIFVLIPKKIWQAGQPEWFVES